MANSFTKEIAERGKNTDYTKMPREEAIFMLLQKFGMDVRLTRSEDAKKLIIDYVNYMCGENTPVNEEEMYCLRRIITKKDDSKPNVDTKEGLIIITEHDVFESIKTLNKNEMSVINSDYFTIDVDSENRLLLTRNYTVTHIKHDNYTGKSGESIRGEQQDETFDYCETSTIDHGIEVDVTYTLVQTSFSGKITSATLLLERDYQMLSRASGSFETSISGTDKEYDLENFKLDGPRIIGNKTLENHANQYFTIDINSNKPEYTDKFKLFGERPILDTSVIDCYICNAEKDRLRLSTQFGYNGNDPKRRKKEEEESTKAHNRLLNSKPFSGFRRYLKQKKEMAPEGKNN